MKRFPFITLLFGALAVSIHAWPTSNAILQFERTAVARGELWRVFTGHFTHFGADHLRWDAIAFLAFGSLVEIRSRRAWLVCLGIASVTISLGIGWFQPQFASYRGLSGLDSALFAFVTADLLREGWRSRDKSAIGFAALALVGFVAKCIYELATGLTLFVAANADFEAVPLAHVLGAAVGVASVFALSPNSRGATAPEARAKTEERIAPPFARANPAETPDQRSTTRLSLPFRLS